MSRLSRFVDFVTQLVGIGFCQRNGYLDTVILEGYGFTTVSTVGQPVLGAVDGGNVDG